MKSTNQRLPLFIFVEFQQALNAHKALPEFTEEHLIALHTTVRQPGAEGHGLADIVFGNGREFLERGFWSVVLGLVQRQSTIASLCNILSSSQGQG